jgi:hypothetical protein
MITNLNDFRNKLNENANIVNWPDDLVKIYRRQMEAISKFGFLDEKQLDMFCDMAADQYNHRDRTLIDQYMNKSTGWSNEREYQQVSSKLADFILNTIGYNESNVNEDNEILTDPLNTWWDSLSAQEKHKIMLANTKRQHAQPPQYSTHDEMSNDFSDVISAYYKFPLGDPKAYSKFIETLNSFNLKYNMNLASPSKEMMVNSFDLKLSNALGDKEGEKISKEDIEKVWKQVLFEYDF